jgi:hypothetical protein
VRGEVEDGDDGAKSIVPNWVSYSKAKIEIDLYEFPHIGLDPSSHLEKIIGSPRYAPVQMYSPL